MLVDAPLQHEVEGWVDRLVEEARGLENKRAELVDELAIKVAEEVAKVEKMEAVQDIKGCGDNQKVKYSAGSLTSRALTWWNSEVKTRGRAAAVGWTGSFLALMKEEVLILLARVLIDEAVRNGSLKRTGERRGDGGESSKEGNVKGDNKRARAGKVFAIIINPMRKEYVGLAPKCTNCNFHYNPETPCSACTNCNRLGNFARDCRVGPKKVNLLNSKNPTAARGVCYECGGTDHYKSACPRLNRAPGQGGNHPNQDMAIDGGQGYGNNGNPTRRRAFVMGAEEARQDPNIVNGVLLRRIASRSLRSNGVYLPAALSENRKN
ncbi:reverse transcriptase domain-containing protein [Tanacetum coccineum]|uniref:Reverse transcriptase domain-containing protein n=1 Tax=Tanacetum coccineum TaxID=301880 RepID=A0ABQ5GDF0_9ASTR